MPDTPPPPKDKPPSNSGAFLKEDIFFLPPLPPAEDAPRETPPRLFIPLETSSWRPYVRVEDLPEEMGERLRSATPEQVKTFVEEMHKATPPAELQDIWKRMLTEADYYAVKQGHGVEVRYATNPNVVRPTGNVIDDTYTMPVLEKYWENEEFRKEYDKCLKESGIKEDELGTLPAGTYSPCTQKALDATDVKLPPKR